MLARGALLAEKSMRSVSYRVRALTLHRVPLGSLPGGGGAVAQPVPEPGGGEALSEHV